MTWKCCIIAILCTIAFGSVAESAPPATTRAAEDSVTSAIEKDILGAPPGAAPDAETQARLQAPRGDDDPRPRTFDAWLQLIHLLGPALIVGVGIGVACS